MGAIIFIDTSKLFDFYRTKIREKELSVFNRINDNHNLIITSSQVEMEYYKGRKNVIERAFSSPINDYANWILPSLLLPQKQSKAIEKTRN